MPLLDGFERLRHILPTSFRSIPSAASVVPNMTQMRAVAGNLPGATRVILADEKDHLTFAVLGSGTMLVTSYLEVTEPTEICFAHDPHGIHISVQYFLEGEATIVMGDGGRADWAQDGTSVIRSDTPGFRLFVKPGQVLRHICVAMYHGALSGTLGSDPSEPIRALMATKEPVNMAVPIRTDSRVRATAEALYALRLAKGIDAIKADGMAISFLSEVLERFDQQDAGSTSQGGVLPWQARMVQSLRAAIEEDPDNIPTNGDMLHRFNMGEQMARRAFQAEFGLTMSAHARAVRLAKARDMLLNGTASIKQVGFDCGYAHVGNFTRAYRQKFGETPSETRRMTKT